MGSRLSTPASSGCRIGSPGGGSPSWRSPATSSGDRAGSADEIRSFCQDRYGVTFPIFDKIEVNGPGRHPLYASLTQVTDSDGVAGDIQWNFEKFLVAPGGESVQRFRPQVEPESAGLVAAIESVLPESS